MYMTSPFSPILVVGLVELMSQYVFSTAPSSQIESCGDGRPSVVFALTRILERFLSQPNGKFGNIHRSNAKKFENTLSFGGKKTMLPGLLKSLKLLVKLLGHSSLLAVTEISNNIYMLQLLAQHQFSSLKYYIASLYPLSIYVAS